MYECLAGNYLTRYCYFMDFYIGCSFWVLYLCISQCLSGRKIVRRTAETHSTVKASCVTLSKSLSFWHLLVETEIKHLLPDTDVWGLSCYSLYFTFSQGWCFTGTKCCFHSHMTVYKLDIKKLKGKIGAANMFFWDLKRYLYNANIWV